MTDTRRPNILFLFTDDQRFDTIRALGNDDIITPNMDSLVESGTAFTNAYIMGGSSPAVCMPSRAMLMSGRTLYHIEEQGQSIPDSHSLFGETLKDAGFSTFGIGKWHSGPRAYARSFSGGSEIFFGGMTDHWNVPACDYDPTGEYKVDTPVCRNPGLSNEVQYVQHDHIKAGTHSSELFCDAAIDFLNSYEEEKPFFIYVSFLAPHDPRTMPRKYLDMYDQKTIALPDSFAPTHAFDNGELEIRDERLAAMPREPDEIRRHIAEYYAMITHADAEIGRVLETLHDSGHADNTIVILAGDNGLAVGRHGLMGKQNLYEHSIHVPLIIGGPGIPKGETRDAFCYLIDIYPTICDMLQIDVPASVEGKSLVPALKNPQERIRDHLLFAYMGLHRGVRTEQYKLIEYVVEGERHTQLFDLIKDPSEVNDLSGDESYSHTIEELRELLQGWRNELGDDSEQGRAFWNGYDG